MENCGVGFQILHKVALLGGGGCPWWWWLPFVVVATKLLCLVVVAALSKTREGAQPQRIQAALLCLPPRQQVCHHGFLSSLMVLENLFCLQTLFLKKVTPWQLQIFKNQHQSTKRKEMNRVSTCDRTGVFFFLQLTLQTLYCTKTMIVLTPILICTL